MAAFQDDAVLHFDNLNNSEIQFIDEEFASITELITKLLMRSFILAHRNYNYAPRIQAKSRREEEDNGSNHRIQGQSGLLSEAARWLAIKERERYII